MCGINFRDTMNLSLLTRSSIVEVDGTSFDYKVYARLPNVHLNEILSFRKGQETRASLWFCFHVLS